MKQQTLLCICICTLIILTSTYCKAKEPEVYMFSYFMGNGEDGLHLAYSLDGLTWEALNDGRSVLSPTAGEDKLMRDPCIIKGGDGNYHMVWTVSWTEKSLGYATSQDLVNWNEQRTIPVMAHEEGARNTWAPEIFYDVEDDIYMIFWSTTIDGMYPETQSNEESGYNHRKYYTTTKDFQNFSPTSLLYEPGFNVIDGTIIKEDNEYIMFIKDETREPAQKNIRITRSNKLNSGYGKASEPITGEYWAEGPTVAKVNGQWIVYFDKYIEKSMGAVASSDLENWKDISEQISFPKGTRHGSVFKISSTELQKLMEKFERKTGE
ncbi:glycoside hydrolase family 43 protein [Belliella sp. DSM 111904]|uniref:Glycoside hydrolase family 43 protein n=1 Tax=Belliella filtrata TaxID=2923435 RepID=A0ABS9UYX4_9BACT|nr:glycoside hydrolase family 43 protein [Belliella filtrata]MCH7409353.1 glycoside hydrolase family 43 protein [Belliella filtrata]